jgi:WD40 repeat protein
MRFVSSLALILMASLLPAAEAPSLKEIDALITLLGDDDAAKRADAAKKLEAIGEPALAALRKTVKAHADIDVRLRAGLVARAVEKTLWKEIRRFETPLTTLLVVSPDGKRAATTFFRVDKYVISLWDTETGKEVTVLEGHTSIINGIAFSRDGKRILSGGLDKTYRLWDAESGKELKKEWVHQDGVFAVAFLADDKHAVTACIGGQVWVWKLSDEVRRTERTYHGGHGVVRGMAVSKDGKRIAMANWDHDTRILDVKSGDVMHTLKGHKEAVTAVAFSPDGKRLVTSSVDKTVRLWDAETGKELRSFADHTAEVTSVCFSPDGTYILTASGDHTARLLSAASLEELHCYEGHTDAVTGAVFTPDGKRVLTAGRDKTIRVWPVVRR